VARRADLDPHAQRVPKSAASARRRVGVSQATPAARLFDLNVEKVLEHWTPAEALREVIANALDEAALTGTADPIIEKTGDGTWVVRDFGRGLRYSHLTQKENREKLKQPDRVIGKFGVGLKDALAVFERRGVAVLIRSRHGDIQLTRAPKAGFDEIVTLQATVTAASDEQVGTEFALHGLTDDDVIKGKGYFLRFANTDVYERGALGEVLARPKGAARIYVNGLLVATEANFLFSYNVTSTTAGLRKALNRERTNVGRTAYSTRVKDILLACISEAVVSRLVKDLEAVTRGSGSDESGWQDISLQACCLLQSREKVVFITSDDLAWRGAAIQHAQMDGYRPVVIPETIAKKLPSLMDTSGNPLRDIGEYMKAFNESFEFSWVDPASLSVAEQEAWASRGALLTCAGRHARQVKDVRLSQTMRLNELAGEVTALWDAEMGRIVIKRSQLTNVEVFAASLLHEVAHASSGADHAHPVFEDALSTLLGIFGAASVATLEVAPREHEKRSPIGPGSPINGQATRQRSR